MSDAALRQCAILVGGLGTRLGSLTATTPKPLVRCGDRPFLAWLMREMQRFGIEEFVLLAGHLSEEIERKVAAIQEHLPKSTRITISVEPVRAGTGGALHYARHLLDERFLLCNGDSIFACNLTRLIGRAISDPTGGNWVLLRAVDDLDRYGAVELARESNHVVAFHPVAQPGQSGLINSGVYLLDHSVFSHVSETCSLEADVLPQLASHGGLKGMVLEGYFRDIGLPGDLSAAELELPRRLLRPSVFLDRDGVINVDQGWVGTRDRFIWTQGVFEALRCLTDDGFHVFIVTNQSGIARGFYTEEDLQGLMDWAIRTIRMQGATIDDWRYCPTHPEAPLAQYRVKSSRRKPGTGMIDELVHAWEVDPAKGVLLGDQTTDMAAGRAAGLRARRIGPQLLADVVLNRSM
ncbi:HAD-IIIA family hydrolase [Acetobacter musti]|uniref:D,D-heptose 1,7-bisphosphate phosphatase n=1 Tax=Acetobacter musti TaxID=864732 RepID=A0ABX0JX73_9PROT|nr:HAD-IIIA family hydrolase [Acetobacter musti]